MDDETEDGDSQHHASVNLEGVTNMCVGRNNVSYHFLEGQGQLRRDIATFTGKGRQYVAQGSAAESLETTTESADNSQGGSFIGGKSYSNMLRERTTEDEQTENETPDDSERSRTSREDELSFQKQNERCLSPGSKGSDSSTGDLLSSSKDDQEVKTQDGHKLSAVLKDTSSSPSSVLSQEIISSTPDGNSTTGSESGSDWEGWGDWEDEQGTEDTPVSDIVGEVPYNIRQPDINIRNVMIGDNNLLIRIGEDVIRHHTIGNIEFQLRIRTFQQRSETIEGRRRINISMQIDEFPTAEAAALEALEENPQCDNSLCSRISQFFSRTTSTVLGFRRGSIVLEIKPESDKTVQELFKAVEDGSFDEIIVDILKQEQVLKQITKNKVQVTIDIIVPNQVSYQKASGSNIVSSTTMAGDITNEEDLRAYNRIQVMEFMKQPMDVLRKMMMAMGSEKTRMTRMTIRHMKGEEPMSTFQAVCFLTLFTMSSLLVNLTLVIFTTKFFAIMTGKPAAQIIGMSVWSFITGVIGSEIDNEIGNTMDRANIKRGTIGGGLLGSVIGACVTEVPAGPFPKILSWSGTILISSAFGDTVGHQEMESVFSGVAVGLTAFDVTGGSLNALMLGLCIFAGRFTANADAASVSRAVIASAGVGSLIGPFCTAVLAGFAFATKVLDAKVLLLMVPLVTASFSVTNEMVALEQVGGSFVSVISSAVIGMLCYNRYEMFAYDKSRDLLAYGGSIGLVFGSAISTVNGSAPQASQTDNIIPALIGGVLADFYIDRSRVRSDTPNRKRLVFSVLAGALIACAFGLMSLQLSDSVINCVLSVTRTVTLFLYIGVELLLHVCVQLGLCLIKLTGNSLNDN